MDTSDMEAGSAEPTGEETEREEGEYSPVQRRKTKRPRHASSNNSTQRAAPNNKLLTPVAGNSFINVNALKLAKAINKEIGPAKGIKRKGKCIVIECYNTKQASTVNNLTSLCGVEVTVSDDAGDNLLRGVITGIDLDITEQELIDAIPNAIRAKRLTKRTDGKLISLRAVLVHFKSKNLPEYVILGYEQKKVSAYRPRVVRCFKCQRYGHAAENCKSKERCPRCGEEHKWANCPNKENPKCANCGGNHSAAYQGCPNYKKAKEISEIKNKEGITYAQAAKKHTTISQNAQLHKAASINSAAAGALTTPSQPTATGAPPVTSHSTVASAPSVPLRNTPAPASNTSAAPTQSTQSPPDSATQTNSEDPTFDIISPTTFCDNFYLKSFMNNRFLAFLSIVLHNADKSKSVKEWITLTCKIASQICNVDMSTESINNIVTLQ